MFLFWIIIAKLVKTLTNESVHGFVFQVTNATEVVLQLGDFVTDVVARDNLAVVVQGQLVHVVGVVVSLIGLLDGAT